MNYLPKNLTFNDGVAFINNHSLLEVSSEHGTPLYVYDWEHIKNNILLFVFIYNYIYKLLDINEIVHKINKSLLLFLINISFTACSEFKRSYFLRNLSKLLLVFNFDFNFKSCKLFIYSFCIYRYNVDA